MNFQNIEYFLTVAEYKNISKAAKSLYISQQSLSENIKRLEDEIGTPLFIRGKTLTLTPAGECFVSGGQKLLKTYDKMMREISVITNTIRCRIVIGVPSCDIPPFLPLTISHYAEKYPEYEITVQPEDASEVPDLLFWDSSDIPPHMEEIPLIKNDTFSVVFSRICAEQTYGQDYSACISQMKKSGNLKLLEKLPFLLLYKRKQMYSFLSQLFDEFGFAPREAFHSTDANLLTSLCINNSGAFIGPTDYCKRKFGPLLDPESGPLLILTIKTQYQPSLSLIYPNGKHLNQAEKHFVSVLMENLNA